MRIDHFLLYTRVVKRRSKIKKFIESRSIQVNGKFIKSSYKIKLKDSLKVIQNKSIFEIKVLKLPESKKDFEFPDQIFSLKIENKDDGYFLEDELPRVVNFLRRE
tara:strand:- start:131 stop:445 length:315 start_codon:yes stop_codon:yes gene_type:complete